MGTSDDDSDMPVANSNQTSAESHTDGPSPRKHTTIDVPPGQHDGDDIDRIQTRTLTDGSRATSGLARRLSRTLTAHLTPPKKVGDAPGVMQSLKAILFGTCMLPPGFGLRIPL